jgi:vancomycin permeability regulator SanA
MFRNTTKTQTGKIVLIHGRLSVSLTRVIKVLITTVLVLLLGLLFLKSYICNCTADNILFLL